MRQCIAVAVICAVLTGCAAGPWVDFYGDMHKTAAPYDVRKFVNNAQACRHYVGEDPYDAGRAKYLEQSIARHCTELEETQIDLRKRYAHNPHAMELITQTWQKFNE